MKTELQPKSLKYPGYRLVVWNSSDGAWIRNDDLEEEGYVGIADPYGGIISFREGKFSSIEDYNAYLAKSK